MSTNLDYRDDYVEEEYSEDIIYDEHGMPIKSAANIDDNFDQESDDIDIATGDDVVGKDFETELMQKNKRKKNKVEEDKYAGMDTRTKFTQIMNDYHSGNEKRVSDAKLDMIKGLEGFIFTIIKKSYSTYAKDNFADLLQEGKTGVLIGMEKYDPEISLPTTFFYPYIKHEMQNLITKQVDKTTPHYSTIIKEINRVIEEFERTGQPYTVVDIAIQTNYTIETVTQAMLIRQYRDEVHLDGCQPGTIDERQFSDKFPTPEEAYIENEQKSIIYNAIEKHLTAQEITVLEMHFGINGKETFPEGEISKKLGIPKDKVKKLINSSIRKLRTSELRGAFKDYLAHEDDLVADADFSLIPKEAAERDIEYIIEALDEDENFSN